MSAPGRLTLAELRDEAQRIGARLSAPDRERICQLIRAGYWLGIDDALRADTPADVHAIDTR